MRASGLHHVALKAKDVARMADFYRVVLGLPELRRAHDDKGLRAVWLDLSGTILMVERAEHAGPSPAEDAFVHDPPGLFLLAVRIEAAEHPAWRARLAAHGVDVVHQTEATLYVRDPEGNRVGLSSYPQAGAT